MRDGTQDETNLAEGWAPTSAPSDEAMRWTRGRVGSDGVLPGRRWGTVKKLLLHTPRVTVRATPTDHGAAE